METRSLVRSVFELVRGSTSLADLVRLIAEPAGALVDADRVLIAAAPSPDFDPLLFEWTIGAERPDLDALRFALGEAVLLNLQSARPARWGAASELVNRYAATLVLDRPILVGCQTESGGGIAILASRSASRIAQGEAAPRRLGSEEEELLQNFLELATAHLQRPPSGSLAIEESGAARAAADSAAGSSARKAPYHRLVEHSDAIIFTTDAEHRITFISKRVIDFFGVPAEEFLGHGELEWFDLIHLEDRDRARRLVDEQLARGGTFDEELRIINHITGRLRWLLVKLTPVRDSESKIVGWDGFGVDITARRDAQDALEQQSKKVRALYTVSSSVRGYLDPASIAARGLEALCDATGAHAAACYLFPTQRSRKLGLVAHHGFSPSLIDLLSAEESLGADGSPSTEGLPGLLYPVVESGQPYVIPDLGRDVRARKLFGDEEGLGAAVLVPVAVEEEVFGALALFHRERGSFDGGDVMLVSAAASQIGLAARQATLFTAYRRQTKNLAALYRLTHELSQFHSLEEVFQQAFSIIRDELGLKRLWLGLLSDSGTHVIGQAAYGPGWKRQLVEINVDVSSQEHPIAEVVRTQKPILISDPGRMLRQFGLRRFFSRFGIKTLGVVPLVARGEVLGVLAVQPGAAEPILDEEELHLLSSLANEIAGVVLTRRLEARVGEGERMRTAGLLAAGIAHNFNNLLQAVLGQASLLEMQSENPQQVLRAARIIGESSTKGALLVRQLLSFANLEEPHQVRCEINDLLRQESNAFARLLLPNQKLRLSLRRGIPPAMVDTRHLIRVLTNLIQNGAEAMRGKGGPIQLFTDLVQVTKESPHVEVPLGTYITISVRDSGVGMDQETKRRCFEPFFTTKDVDPSSGLGLSGSGMGLAAAYSLARKNGGRLVVDSRLGIGSLFTVYVKVDESVLPQADDQDDDIKGADEINGSDGHADGLDQPGLTFRLPDLGFEQLEVAPPAGARSV